MLVEYAVAKVQEPSTAALPLLKSLNQLAVSDEGLDLYQLPAVQGGVVHKSRPNNLWSRR